MAAPADRRTAIASAFDKASEPTAAPRVPSTATHLQMAGAVVRHAARHDRLVPGGTTKLLYALPPDDQQRVREVATLYAAERESGRHGDPERVLTAFEIDKTTADAVADGLEMDYVAAELQRRRPTDGDGPLPELTRRDYIEAAIDTHSTQE